MTSEAPAPAPRGPASWFEHRRYSYGLALLSTGLATVFTNLLASSLGGAVQAPFLAAVVVTALFAGMGPGLVASGLSALALQYYFTPPVHTMLPLLPEGMVKLEVFLAISLPLTWLSASLRSANKKLEAARDDSKQATALAQCETARAKEANRFLDSILENIPDMIFVKDAKTHQFLRFNRAGEVLLGWRRQDLLGKTDDDFFPPDEARFFREKDSEVLKKKVLVDIPEERVQTRYGEPAEYWDGES